MNETTTTPNNAGTTETVVITTPPAAELGQFKQSDIDRILAERLPRAEEAAQRKMLEALGVKDADELKGKLANLSKMETDRLSESERQQKEIADAKAEIEKANKREQEKSQRADDRLRLSAIRTAATDKFNPDAYDDMWRYIKDNKSLYAQLKVTDDDEVEGVADVLKELEEKKKLYLKQAATTTTQPAPRGTPSNQSNRTPAVPPANDAARDAFRREIKNW